jgi:subtilisin-like proprotein convertase family protein
MTRHARSRFLRFAAPAVALALTPVVAQATSYTQPGGALLDNTSLSLQFPVVDAGNVVSVDLTMTGLTHTWAGDLIATLQAPDGTTADIMRRVGATSSSALGDSSNFGGTYRYIDSGVDPVPPLVALDTNGVLASGDYWATTLGTATNAGNKVNLNLTFGGHSAAGLWTLTISDNAGGDTGSLQSATLNVNTVPEPATIGALSLAGAGLLVRRRRSVVSQN